MDITELRDMDAPELKAELLRQRKEAFELRMRRASGQLGQTHLLRESRRNIARIKTVMREARGG